MTNAEAADVLKITLNSIPIYRGDGKSMTKIMYIEALCKAIDVLKKGTENG